MFILLVLLLKVTHKAINGFAAGFTVIPSQGAKLYYFLNHIQ